jgi:hypothetical protein
VIEFIATVLTDGDRVSAACALRNVDQEPVPGLVGKKSQANGFP